MRAPSPTAVDERNAETRGLGPDSVPTLKEELMPWQYDTNLSKVEWAVQYLGIAVIKGNFKEVQAVLNFEDPDPTKWSVEATIDAASFSSGGYGGMEGHVRWPELHGVD